MTSQPADGTSAVPGFSTPRITTVIVAHNGTRWLPRLIAALESGTHSPGDLIAVDTGSTDGSLALLSAAFGASAVHAADPALGFGAAVECALGIDRSEEHDPDGWLWLLHDDCAPASDALEQLILVGESDPDIGVVGGRVRAWPRAQRLLEVGVSVTGTGHRETGVEAGEYDQGQHDEQRDVLSVSSAGMLVRRKCWDALGGFDSRLPLFRDDLDFGWRVAKAGGRVVLAPRAVIFHAEAATRGARPLDAVARVPNSPHRADRQAALFTLLANCRARAFPFQYARLVIGTIVRAVGYLLGKLPGVAADELLAMFCVLGRPDRIVRARARRRVTSVAPPQNVRALLPPWWTPYENGLDAVLSLVADRIRSSGPRAGTTPEARPGAADGEAIESGPASDEAVNLPVGRGPVTWALDHPILVLNGALIVAAALGTRGLWGGGWLQGGALLPAPASGSTWWQTYTESWHQVGTGSQETPSPYIVVLAMLATVLLGKSWLVVQLIVVLAVPLSSIGAYVAARHLVAGVGPRLWMSLSYALLPALSGAVTSGHLGTTVAMILLPWLVPASRQLISSEQVSGWRSVFATGLVLSLIVAFAPIAWPMAAVAGLAVTSWLAVIRPRPVSRLVRPLLAVVIPGVLLVPWSWRFMTTPSLFLTEAGKVDIATSAVSDHAWMVPWGRVMAAGDGPWWLSLGVVLAAVVALLRSDRRAQVVAAWAVVALGLATTAVLARDVVTAQGSTDQAFVWVGLPVLVAQAAAIVAAGLGADGIIQVMRSGSFGWRQPLAAVAVVTAALAPIAGLAWWVTSAPEGSLVRAQAVPLPAYMLDAMQVKDQRVLVITAIGSSASPGTKGPAVAAGVSYADTYRVYAQDGYRLGDDSIVVPPPRGVGHLVAGLTSEATSGDLARLSDLGIAYVVMPAPYDKDQVAQLDGLPGLSRSSTAPRRLSGWQVDGPSRQPPSTPMAHRGLWITLEAILVLVAVVLSGPAIGRGELRRVPR